MGKISSKRKFSFSEDNKGLPCPFKSIHCQEGWCDKCQVYLDRHANQAPQTLQRVKREIS